MKDLTGIERFICSEWSGWDLLDTAVFMFYDPVIHEPIYEKLGEKFDISYIVVNCNNCTVDFYDQNEECLTLDFALVI